VKKTMPPSSSPIAPPRLHELFVNQAPLRYELRRLPRRRRTLSLHVESSGQVVLRAPQWASQATVERFLLGQIPWILKRQRQLREADRLFPPAAYGDNDRFPWLGETVGWQAAGAPLAAGPVLSPAARDEAARRKIVAFWYRAAAANDLRARVQPWAPVVGKSPVAVALSAPRRRWGSCSAQGAIRLHWRLVLAPVLVAEYVVVHELCHLLQPNHSERFWRQVERCLPGYDAPRAWLRKNGSALMNFGNPGL
jgi:predicted metal-dependent hydrolase